jgi:hypothetical protein
MQRMKFSYITPRPVHTGQDKGKQEEFRKNKLLLFIPIPITQKADGQ